MELRQPATHQPQQQDNGRAVPSTVLFSLQVDVCSACDHDVTTAVWESSGHDVTTAVWESSGAGAIHVTLRAARPPRVSTLQVCCSGSLPPSEAYIVATELNFVLLAVSVNPRRYEYFMYRLAQGVEERPFLELLLATPISLDDSHVGILPHKDDYFVTALCYTESPGEYDLHLYSSRTGRWTKKEGLLNKNQEQMGYYHVNHKVIVVGGEAGTICWVDLKNGGILCYALLCPGTQLQYITLPLPILEGKKLEGCPRSCRDIAVVNGRIHYVELQIHTRTGTSSRGTYLADGWILVKWSTSATGRWVSDCWQQDYKLDASDISIPANKLAHFELLRKLTDDEGAAQPTLVALHTGHPTLCLHDDQIVYLMTKEDYLDEKAWVLAIDMRNKTLQGVADFTADRVPGFCFTYTHARVSQYLIMASDTRDNLDC